MSHWPIKINLIFQPEACRLLNINKYQWPQNRTPWNNGRYIYAIREVILYLLLLITEAVASYTFSLN